jgi:Raf kinase inhibitor-like YbhB/YbcL family protein
MPLTLKKTLTITSPAFKNNGDIPSKHTCEGEGISPELNIENIPEETKSLALIVDDPDAPHGTFDHWIMWNIAPNNKIAENSSPGKQGLNGKKEKKYYGPCPPSGTHHYHFKIYALDTEFELPDECDKDSLMKAMEGHIIGQGEIVGLYKKKK